MKKIGAGLLAFFALFLMFSVSGNHHVNAAGKAKNYGYVSTKRTTIKEVPKQFRGTWYLYDKGAKQYLTYKFGKHSVSISEKLKAKTSGKLQTNIHRVTGSSLIVNRFKDLKNSYTFAGRVTSKSKQSTAIAFYYFRIVKQNVNGKTQKVLVTANPYESKTAYKFLSHKVKHAYTGKSATYFYKVK